MAWISITCAALTPGLPAKDTSRFPEEEINAHAANMHMVPSTPELADRLRAINRGDLVDIRGYLVEIKFADGGSMAQFPDPHGHRQRRLRVSLGQRRL